MAGRPGDRCPARANVTIERRGRKGRKERQYYLAAFAAFAFQSGVSSPDLRRGQPQDLTDEGLLLAVFRVHAARHLEHVPLALVDVGPFDREDAGDYGVRVREVDPDPETVTGHHT